MITIVALLRAAGVGKTSVQACQGLIRWGFLRFQACHKRTASVRGAGNLKSVRRYMGRMVPYRRTGQLRVCCIRVCKVSEAVPGGRAGKRNGAAMSSDQ
jgi:hypothetical protein